MKETERKIEKSFEDFENRVLETTISAINDKQVEVNYWKEKAQKLADKFKVCLEHGEQKCEYCYGNPRS